jgi:leucyl aminopeptidase
MIDQALPCVPALPGALPIHAIRPDAIDRFYADRDPAQVGYARASGFGARPQELVLLPGDGGVAGAMLGLGEDTSPYAFGDLAMRLPVGPWRFADGDFDLTTATLGFCLGAYRFHEYKPPKREPATLVSDSKAAIREAASLWMVRDLVNAPANLLGPAELADVTLELAKRHGGTWTRVEGEALTRQYPTVAAVGEGSARKPVVAAFTWRGSGADATAPLISLCGKGVCFDTGGYDLKPSSGMLRMKKDMGGAAAILGIARIVMDADLPVRLTVRIGCVENSVSGKAMRPLDVIRTRKGLSVEVGNTDAEGRLVLCDLLAEASDEAPDVLLDFATLTGAARVALGPDLPALFSNDDRWAEIILSAGRDVHDPVWRLPLWPGYDIWLESNIADLNNVTTKPGAGAITAALFLQRFVGKTTAWAHVDTYAWNDTNRPGKPEGGEGQAVRAIVRALINEFCVTK